MPKSIGKLHKTQLSCLNCSKLLLGNVEVRASTGLICEIFMDTKWASSRVQQAKRQYKIHPGPMV